MTDDVDSCLFYCTVILFHLCGQLIKDEEGAGDKWSYKLHKAMCIGKENLILPSAVILIVFLLNAHCLQPKPDYVANASSSWHNVDHSISTFLSYVGYTASKSAVSAM